MLKHESDGASTRGEVWADRCFKGIVFETPELPGVWHPCVNRALIDNGDSPALVIDAVREAGPFDASRPDLGDVRILDGAGREVPYLNVYAGRFIRISPFAGTSIAWLNRHSLGVNAPTDLANKNAATKKPAIYLFSRQTFDWNLIKSAFAKDQESAGRGTRRRWR